MAEISLVGLSASDPVPGNYLEIDFGAGQVSGNSAPYTALLIGGMLSTGSAVPDTTVYGPATPISLNSEADAIALFGAGSELHRMYRRWTALNQVTPLSAIAVSESASSPVKATGTITFTTTATGAGSVRVWIGDQFCDTGFSANDTPTVIATAVVKSINAMLAVPVLATSSGGVVTITALQAGLRGNFIRYMAQMRPTTSGTTVSPVVSTACASGAVTDSNATALATIAASRFFYLVSAAEDATQLGALLTQVNTQALAITGIRQGAFAASVDTLANTITITTALNGARAEVAWMYKSDVPPCELAANMAALYALEEAQAVPRCNFSGYPSSDADSANWRLKAPNSTGAIPTRSQISAALQAGVTPIGIYPDGRTYLVKRITTRFLSGSNPDYRIRDSHKRSISDFYGDDLQAKFAATFSGKVIGNDPKLNDPDPAPNVVTPRVIKASVNRLTHDYAEDGLLQNVANIVLGTIVQRSATVTRMSVQIPLQPVDILDQIATQLLQVA